MQHGALWNRGVWILASLHNSLVRFGTYPFLVELQFSCLEIVGKRHFHSISSGFNEIPICMWKCLAQNKIKLDVREDI